MIEEEEARGTRFVFELNTGGSAFEYFIMGVAGKNEDTYADIEAVLNKLYDHGADPSRVPDKYFDESFELPCKEEIMQWFEDHPGPKNGEMLNKRVK